VTHDDYQQQPLPPMPPPDRPSYTPNPHKLESRTTTAEAYQKIPLPRGVQALGVRTQHGGVHELISAGTLPPARGSAVFTTTRDQQTEVVITAVAVYGGEPFELGAFELGGIPPSLTGIPQVIVTFELDSSRVLRVSAVNAASGLSESLTIRHQAVSLRVPEAGEVEIS